MDQFDLVVIGGGPGGYVAALRAAQLGLKVACVEREPQLGGTCLRVGCIPSKALLESSAQLEAAHESLTDHGIHCEGVSFDLGSMLARKNRVVDTLARGIEGLLKKGKIQRLTGHGRITGPQAVEVEQADGTTTLQTRRILIATGSRPAPLRGIEFDGDRIGTSTEALAWDEVPEHLVVIGGGYIGLELGSVWRRLGSRVTILEYLDHILPGTDSEVAELAGKLFRKQGLEIETGSRVTGATVHRDICRVEVDGREPLECDRLLVAAGRLPCTDGLGLEEAGIATDDRGRIVVDDDYRTNVESVYAVGDVIPGPMLAHKAEHEGIVCIERIVTGAGRVNYDAVPGVAYTEPEIASVGRTEDELLEAGVPYRRGVFPFAANGRARAVGHTEGFAKVLAHRETDRVLGVHIIGPRAGDLISEAVAAIQFGASAEDLSLCVHPHPTLAEAVGEAALAVDGHSLHS